MDILKRIFKKIGKVSTGFNWKRFKKAQLGGDPGGVVQDPFSATEEARNLEEEKKEKEISDNMKSWVLMNVMKKQPPPWDPVWNNPPYKEKFINMYGQYKTIATEMAQYVQMNVGNPTPNPIPDVWRSQEFLILMWGVCQEEMKNVAESQVENFYKTIIQVPQEMPEFQVSQFSQSPQVPQVQEEGRTIEEQNAKFENIFKMYRKKLDSMAWGEDAKSNMYTAFMKTIGGKEGFGATGRNMRLNFFAKYPNFLPEDIRKQIEDNVQFGSSEQKNKLAVSDFLRDNFDNSKISDIMIDLIEEGDSNFTKALMKELNVNLTVEMGRGEAAPGPKDSLNRDLGEDGGEVSQTISPEEQMRRVVQKEISPEEKVKETEEEKQQRIDFTNVVREEANKSDGLIPGIVNLSNKIADVLDEEGQGKVEVFKGRKGGEKKSKNKRNWAERLRLYSGILQSNMESVLQPENFVNYGKRRDSVLYKTYPVDTKQGRRGAKVEIPLDLFIRKSEEEPDVETEELFSKNVRNWEPRLDQAVPNSQLALVQGKMAEIKEKIKNKMHKNTKDIYNKKEKGRIVEEFKIPPQDKDFVVNDLAKDPEVVSELRKFLQQYNMVKGDKNSMDDVERTVRDFINLTLDQSYDYVWKDMISITGESSFINLKGKKKSRWSPMNHKATFREIEDILRISLEVSDGVESRILRTFGKFMSYRTRLKNKMKKKLEERDAYAGTRSSMIYMKYCDTVDKLYKLYKLRNKFSNFKFSSKSISCDNIIKSEIKKFINFIQM